MPMDLQMTVESRGEADTHALGAAIAKALRAGDVILLQGSLGAGKSTLARGLLAELGFTGEVASPTFPIMLTYEDGETRLPLAHCDFYRLETPDEAEELGLSDWLYDGALLAEWPDKGPDWLSRDALTVHIEMMGDRQRRLTVSGSAAWKDRWPIPYL